MEPKTSGFFTGFITATAIIMAVAVGLMLHGRDHPNRLAAPAPCPECKCKQPTAPGPAVPNRRTGDTGELAK